MFCYVFFRSCLCVCVCSTHLFTHRIAWESSILFWLVIFFLFCRCWPKAKNKTSNEITSLNEEIMISYIYFHFTWFDPHHCHYFLLLLLLLFSKVIYLLDNNNLLLKKKTMFHDDDDRYLLLFCWFLFWVFFVWIINVILNDLIV